jgi:hypothetical protein
MRLAIYVVLLGLSLAAEFQDQNGLSAPPVPNAQGRLRKKRHGISFRCESSPIPLTPTRLTPAQAQEAVFSQNLLRSMEPAADMLALSWSDELAAKAQAWANQCHWGYGMLDDCERWPSRMGQTVFVADSTAGNTFLNMTQAARYWHNQRSGWNFLTATCNSGYDCCDFTQVVWSRSNEVGCGYAQCPRMAAMNTILNNAIFVVCDYYPPGNMVDLNGNLLPVYMSGPACSACDCEVTGARTGAGYKCNNNLCEPCSPSSDVTCRCGSPSQACQNNGVWSNATCSCQCSNEFYGTWCDSPCSCEDQMPRDCPDLRLQGYCLDFDYRDFMITNCRRTCDFPCIRPANCRSTERSN